MWKRVLLGTGAVLAMGVAGFLTFAPAYVERGMNPVTMPAEGWPVTAEAQALHDRLVIGDWHSDALLWDRDLLDRADRGHTDVPRLLDGNMAVQVFTTVTKSPRGQNYDYNATDTGDNITPLFIGQLRPPRSWFSLRERALVPTTRLQPASASSSVSTILALPITSLAPAASAMAWESGFTSGFTSQRLVRPMVFMARATEPMLPV